MPFSRSTRKESAYEIATGTVLYLFQLSRHGDALAEWASGWLCGVFAHGGYFSPYNPTTMPPALAEPTTKGCINSVTGLFNGEPV